MPYKDISFYMKIRRCASCWAAKAEVCECVRLVPSNLEKIEFGKLLFNNILDNNINI